ncbi:MAG: hypothetical protein ACRENE_19980 [Polyangiaceae bacterium]
MKPSKAAALASLRSVIAGTQKHTPNGSLTFGNVTYAAPALVQTLQGLLDAMAAHDAAVTQARDLLLAQRDTNAKVGPVYRAYRRFLVVTYGDATQTLADYGLQPLKARAPQTVEQKAAAAAQLRATRAARGTTSKKQKAAIKGVVTKPATTVANPPPAPAPVAPPAKPAT